MEKIRKSGNWIFIVPATSRYQVILMKQLQPKPEYAVIAPKKHYAPKLGVRDTEKAIWRIKKFFSEQMEGSLSLQRVSAPLFLETGTGLQDNLNGVERAVSFDILTMPNKFAEVPHSLAKWKRMALAQYGYKPGEGLWTDMNAIRRDETTDNLHSMYVDQYDWERVMHAAERNPEFLRFIVDRIYDAIRKTEEMVHKEYGIRPCLPDRIQFVTTMELEDRYPKLSRKERENAAAREHGAIFLGCIGGKLKDGQPHDGRAPDYDDWKLNGDIVVWNPVLEMAFELSSMGIRVNHDTLLEQLGERNAMDRLGFEFHKALVEGRLPQSVGGGIGQSRLCMQLLHKAHIGEVQVSVWPEEMRNELIIRHNIRLL